MKKLAAILVIAVLVPSIVLAILALEAQDDQEFVIERQRALVHQGTVDALTAEIADYLDAEHERFRDVVRGLLVDGGDPEAIAGTFDGELRRVWPLAETGFVTELASGRLLAPASTDEAGRVGRFIELNVDFLCAGRAQQLFAWQAGGVPETDAAPVPAAETVAESLVVEQDNALLFNQFRRQKLRGNESQQSAFYKIADEDIEAAAPAEVASGQAGIDGSAAADPTGDASRPGTPDGIRNEPAADPAAQALGRPSPVAQRARTLELRAADRDVDASQQQQQAEPPTTRAQVDPAAARTLVEPAPVQAEALAAPVQAAAARAFEAEAA